MLQDVILLYATWQSRKRPGISLSLLAATIAVASAGLAVLFQSWDLLLWGFGLHRTTILLELWAKVKIQQLGATSLFLINIFGIMGAFVGWYTQMPELFAIVYPVFWGLTLLVARRMQKYRTSPSRI